jgi:alkylhydroperoxidase family enzyme
VNSKRYEKDEDGGRARVVAELTEAVLGPNGHAPIEKRRAAFAFGEQAATDDAAEPPPALEEREAALAAKVARHAYRITDEDVDELKQQGTAEEELFDLIVSTAVGAGRGRRKAGLEAVDAWERSR